MVMPGISFFSVWYINNGYPYNRNNVGLMHKMQSLQSTIKKRLKFFIDVDLFTYKRSNMIYINEHKRRARKLTFDWSDIKRFVFDFEHGLLFEGLMENSYRNTIWIFAAWSKHNIRNEIS